MSMLKLNESGERLASFCRQVEAQAVLPSALGKIELPVGLVPDFSGMPAKEPSRRSFIEHNEAVYLVHDKQVLVNESRFFNISAEAAVATLAHEAGHRVCAKAREMNYDLGYGNLDEEIMVDALACDWGFYNEICELRRARYGYRYCALLSSREPRDEFAKKMNEWHQQYLLEKTLAALKWK